MEYVDPIRDKKQIELMKAVLKGKSKRDWLLFVLGINSGLRISDLLNLKVSDVRDKDRVSLREIKTNKAKDFPLSMNCRKAIAEYLKDAELLPGDPLFSSRKHDSTGNLKPISRQQAYDILSDAAAAVGIKDAIGTHTLRKTFGYHAFKAGHDITLIQKLFNHSAPSVTLRYIGITKQELDRVYIDLNL